MASIFSACRSWSCSFSRSVKLCRSSAFDLTRSSVRLATSFSKSSLNRLSAASVSFWAVTSRECPMIRRTRPLSLRSKTVERTWNQRYVLSA